MSNVSQWLIAGSNPSILPLVSNETTENYLVIEGCLAPNHGVQNGKDIPENITRVYKSDKTGAIYFVAENSFYTFEPTGVITRIDEISDTLNKISFSENLNSQITIATGSALYVYNYSTAKGLQKVTTAQGLQINEPISCIDIDTITFVADSKTSMFQASSPNNALDFSNNETFQFESKAGNIKGLAEVDRTLFVIGDSAVERWVVVGGQQLINRDNVFLLPYGLYDEASLADDFNMFVGLFSSKKGGLQVLAYESASEGFKPLTPSGGGLVKRMMALQESVTSADLYEVDQVIFYELAFESRSFIYNFANETWAESTAPKTAVFYLSETPYVAANNSIYELTPYTNTLRKRRVCAPQFLDKNLVRSTMGDVKIFYSNPSLEKASIMFSGSKNQAENVVSQTISVDESLYFGSVARYYETDCVQFAPEFSTTSNLILRGMTATVENYVE